jgi:hypothetical protein
VSHEVAEQESQLFDEDFTRLPPPPIPKEEMSFWISFVPHFTQVTFFSPPIEVRVSNEHPQALQENS